MWVRTLLTVEKTVRAGSGTHGTGKFATGLPVILGLCLDGATVWFIGRVHGAIGPFSTPFQRGYRFLSTKLRGRCLFCCEIIVKLRGHDKFLAGWDTGQPDFCLCIFSGAINV